MDLALNNLRWLICPDNAKCVADFRSSIILFRDVIKPQVNRENCDTEFFEQAENENNTKCTI